MNHTKEKQRSALFPLNTVLFPGCTLPLQIFEQRYLTLIKNCLKNSCGFIVILISNDKDVSDRPEICSIGTYVEIVDWDKLDNGLLGITVQSRQRVRVSNLSSKDDGLLTGDFEHVAEETSTTSLVSDFQDLVNTLKSLENHPFIASQKITIDYSDDCDISNKLSHLLPINNTLKQSLLEIDKIEDRLNRLRNITKQLQK